MEIQWTGCSEKNFPRGKAIADGLRPTGYRDSHLARRLPPLVRPQAMWFNNPAKISQVSAHYIVAKSGAIHQYP